MLYVNNQIKLLCFVVFVEKYTVLIKFCVLYALDLGTNESGKVKTPNFVRTLRGSSNSQVRLILLHSYRITGLNEFGIANGLKKGDHVKFELIRSGKKPIVIVSSITFCYSD
ncbi:putative transcription factor B3-Domain family [Helianthus anomalus]